MSILAEIETLLTTKGTRRYGLHHVSQLQHALQAALLAEQQNELASLIAAALLHDIGHMIRGIGSSLPACGRPGANETGARTLPVMAGLEPAIFALTAEHRFGAWPKAASTIGTRSMGTLGSSTISGQRSPSRSACMSPPNAISALPNRTTSARSRQIRSLA